MGTAEAWPSLPLEAWRETYRTLHMYSQVVGKIRLARAPMMNHWWQVPLYVTARGLTTSPIPSGEGTFELSFDFFEGVLILSTTGADVRRVPLGASVARFYEQVLAELGELGIRVHLWPMPVEVADPVRFDQDHRAVQFDAQAVRRFFRALASVDQVLKRFRAPYFGKSSPVHFFWGSFDLAVTRFSGRPAPMRGGDRLNACAYNAELASVGFWPGGDLPGGGRVEEAVLYAYSYPRPAGLDQALIRPAAAAWHETLGEFLLPYEAVRRAPDPAQAILDFAESAFQAGAHLAGWPADVLRLRPESAQCL